MKTNQELELFNGKRDFKPKTMTVKEVAEILGVTDRTIRNYAEKLRNDLSGVKNNQGGYLFNESDVTKIKLVLQENPRATQINSIKTNLEKALIIQQAAIFQQEIINSLTIENEQLKIENRKMEPKAIIHDKFMTSDGLYEVSTVAKMIRGNVGRNKLLKWMRDNKIIMGNNDPYQNHKHHIIVRLVKINGNTEYRQALLTPSGVKYILENY